MKKLMQPLLLSLALCGGIVIQNDVLHAMRAPIDGLEASASFGRDDDGNTPLIAECGLMPRYLDPAQEEAMVGIVTQLINAGVDLNAQNKHGRTALITALAFQNEQIAHLLLDAHADVNIQDARGNTALSEAATWGYTSVVKHLLAQQNININAKNKDGWTALMEAAIWNRLEIVRLLILAGAERDIENFKHHNVYYLVEVRRDLLPWQKELLQIALSFRPFPQNPERKCAICCEEDGGEFTLLELCGHYFHTGCLNNWLRVKKSCPLCRRDVPFHDRTFTIPPAHTDETKETK
ncbi:MAG: ankyrin repeat domain-containing protein [Candidatus Babeliales bacterium]|jgi:hypothetical protein